MSSSSSARVTASDSCSLPPRPLLPPTFPGQTLEQRNAQLQQHADQSEQYTDQLEQRISQLEQDNAELKNRLHAPEPEQKIDFSPLSANNKSPAVGTTAVFARDDKGKFKCQKCPNSGDVRKDHVVGDAHLKAVLHDDGTPKYYCRGECKNYKPRNAEPPLCSETPLGNLLTFDFITEHRSVIRDDRNNVHCTVCGGAVQLAVPTDVDRLNAPSQQPKKRKTTHASSQSSTSEFSSTGELGDD
jgi:hypothetical protein